MSNWAVFLTARRAPRTALNRALVLMQDFEYSSYPEDNRYVVLTSKSLPSQPIDTAFRVFETEIANNDFAGMSLADINTFVRAQPKEDWETAGVSSADWVVIDQKGLETSTCLVCEQYYDPGSEDGGEADVPGLTEDFRAVRLPYEEAWSVIANLDIANMDFEEFVDEEAGEQEDGSWNWRSFEPSSVAGGDDEGESERAKALKDLQDAGNAD